MTEKLPAEYYLQLLYEAHHFIERNPDTIDDICWYCRVYVSDASVAFSSTMRHRPNCPRWRVMQVLQHWEDNDPDCPIPSRQVEAEAAND